MILYILGMHTTRILCNLSFYIVFGSRMFLNLTLGVVLFLAFSVGVISPVFYCYIQLLFKFSLLLQIIYLHDTKFKTTSSIHKEFFPPYSIYLFSQVTFYQFTFIFIVFHFASKSNCVYEFYLCFSIIKMFALYSLLLSFFFHLNYCSWIFISMLF